MKNFVYVLYTVLLSSYIYDAFGGEHCEASSQTLTVNQYCEVGGCCIPGNLQTLSKNSELCCVNFLIVILICVFIGLPIFVLTAICLVIVIIRCVKTKKQTSITSLPVARNNQPQELPKPPAYSASEIQRTCPVYSPNRLWQSRPSMVLPGAISHSRGSQHAQPVPSGSRDNTHQSNFPTSPPPPYSSRVSAVDRSLSASSVSTTASQGSRDSPVTIPTTDRNRSPPIAIVDLTESENEAQESDDLAYI
ncbi:uncharacterized protein [Argopecten irradians]|uniref:uncharacterized protein n=1 Tax=Argopecten irradians TaxID=31199 RepID=UPI003711C378